MKSCISRILDSTYVKIAFGALLGFVGIVAGIYVGHALVSERGNPLQQTPGMATGQERPGPHLEFDLGDLFPLEDYLEADGSQSNFEQLLQVKGKETVLLFVNFGCQPCKDLLAQWNTQVAPFLKPNVQVVLCLPQEHSDIPEEHEHLIADKHVIYYDEELFAGKYRLTSFPTVVGVDQYGFVNHIQFGFRETLDPDLLDLFTKSDRQNTNERR
jgi:thiol-disulfide isomerase/thioredoxin